MKIYSQKQFQALQRQNLNMIDTTDFKNACQIFRQICSQIGELIGVENFKGGYDDMTVFYSHEAYKTDKGMQLAIAWSGCNELCKYQANKLNKKSPDWWYECWANENLN